MEKCSDHADADVSKLCRSVSPNPVKCPVKRVKDILSYNHSVVIFASKWTHVGLDLCVLSEIYESGMRDAQVDGSLSLSLYLLLLLLVVTLHILGISPTSS